eukprot:SAG11_NODE_192_length_12931_cov_5.747682_18_plen_300_part_00
MAAPNSRVRLAWPRLAWPRGLVSVRTAPADPPAFAAGGMWAALTAGDGLDADAAAATAGKTAPRVAACFFGHDHHSDAVFFRDGVYLCYGRVGGTTPPIDWEGDGVRPSSAICRPVWLPSTPALCVGRVRSRSTLGRESSSGTGAPTTRRRPTGLAPRRCTARAAQLPAVLRPPRGSRQAQGRKRTPTWSFLSRRPRRHRAAPSGRSACSRSAWSLGRFGVWELVDCQMAGSEADPFKACKKKCKKVTSRQGQVLLANYEDGCDVEQLKKMIETDQELLGAVRPIIFKFIADLRAARTN